MSQPISDVYEKDSEKTTPRRDEGEGGKEIPAQSTGLLAR